MLPKPFSDIKPHLPWMCFYVRSLPKVGMITGMCITGVFISVSMKLLLLASNLELIKKLFEGKLSTKYAVEVWLNTEYQCQESIRDPHISTTTRFLSLAFRLPVSNLLSLLLIETTRVQAKHARLLFGLAKF